MRRLTFSIKVGVPKERLWEVLLTDDTYCKWTSVFREGSYALTDWEPGSKALFLTPDGNGMVSKIVAHRPGEFLCIQHLGFVKDGVEEIAGADEKGWVGAFENYTLKEEDGISTLTVEMDVSEEYESFLCKTWPRALYKLKELAESERPVEKAKPA